jgi:predicted dehydrogenase
MTDPLRFGILGAAKIAPLALIEPARLGREAQVVAVAARDEGRARAFAEQHAIPRVSPDYAALIDDPEVDVVYNALPMSLHAHWSIRALRAGKHVLCEKPFAANATQAEQMVAVGEETGLVLAEAFHYRYHPLFDRVLGIVHSGALGTLRRLEAMFKVAIVDRSDLRHRYETAGGATMDLGCYPLHWLRTIAGSEPQVISARAKQGEPNVDIVMQVDLCFPGGIEARMFASMEEHEEYRTTLSIEGDRGQLSIENPLVPHAGHQLRFRVGDEWSSEQVAGETTYRHQLVAFCAAVRGERTLPTVGRDSIANMRVIDAVYRAAGLTLRGEGM